MTADEVHDVAAAAAVALRGYNYSVESGATSWSAIGAISNPNGAYGILRFDNAAAFPPADSKDQAAGDAFCSCLASGNTSVSVACQQLQVPHVSVGAHNPET